MEKASGAPGGLQLFLYCLVGQVILPCHLSVVVIIINNASAEEYHFIRQMTFVLMEIVISMTFPYVTILLFNPNSRYIRKTRRNFLLWFVPSICLVAMNAIIFSVNQVDISKRLSSLGLILIYMFILWKTQVESVGKANVIANSTQGKKPWARVGKITLGPLRAREFSIFLFMCMTITDIGLAWNVEAMSHMESISALLWVFGTLYLAKRDAREKKLSDYMFVILSFVSLRILQN